MAEKTKKEDRRIRYTKQVIKDTLLQLLEKNHFAKITVTELCRMAEINRGTFYLHYYDMNDVLDDILNDMLSDTSSVMEHVLSQKCDSPNCSYLCRSRWSYFPVGQYRLSVLSCLFLPNMQKD